MAVFPSPEWLDNYVEALNSDPEFSRSTKGWVWVILFIVEEDGSKRSPGFLVEVADGVCRRHKYYVDAGSVNSPYRLWGPRQAWLDLIQGRIDPTKALGQGRIHVSANQATLGRFVEMAKTLLSCLAAVQSDT